MIAIPLDDQHSTTLSELYGNAPYFALLDLDTGMFKTIENEVVGKGPKSAPYLKEHGATATVFYHMGDGVYKAFASNGMDVCTAEHQHLTIDEIYLLCLDDRLTKLHEDNYKSLLDPGSGANCTCGCENH